MAKCQAGTSSFRKCSKLATNKQGLCVFMCYKGQIMRNWLSDQKCFDHIERWPVLTQNEKLKVNCTWSGPKSLSKIKSVCKLHCTHRVRTDFKCKLMNQNFWLQNIKIYYRNSRKSWILKPENYVILGRVISSEMYTFAKKIDYFNDFQVIFHYLHTQIWP